MPKKIGIIALLLFLGFFMLFKLNKLNRESDENKENKIAKNNSKENTLKSETPPQQQKNSPQANTPKFAKKDSPMEERVYEVRDLPIDLNSPIGKQNLESLIVFINSKNPFSDHPEAGDPHSFITYQQKREASLRIFALKRMTNALSRSQAKPFLENVVQNSSDKAIARVAEQILEHAKNGNNYFEMVKKGVSELPLGDEKKPANGNHDHDHGHQH